jgi:predicted  nucleic acid-binding Zn-ribbon protein
VIKISFIKKIFNFKPKQEEIPAIELKEWLDSYSQDKFERINNKIRNYSEKFRDKISEVKDLLNNLRETELLNKNISPREIHVMRGNREAYINKVSNFINSIEIPEKEYNEILKFCKSFEEKLDELNKSSRRSYYILKNFFNTEMLDIAQGIKNLEDIVIKSRETLMSKQVRLINALNNKIHDLNSCLIKKNSLEKEISQLETELERLHNKKDNLHEKVNNIKESNDFMDFKKLKNKKESLNHKINNLEKEINNLFFSINRLLKKFHRKTLNQELIQDYLENSSDALLEDKNIGIIKELNKMKELIEKDEIKLKNKDKFLEKLEKITEKFLKQKRKEILENKEKINKINSKIEKITITMDYKELEYQIDHFSEKIKKIEQEKKEKNKQLEELNIDSKIEKLETLIYEITNVKVNIK